MRKIMVVEILTLLTVCLGSHYSVGATAVDLNDVAGTLRYINNTIRYARNDLDYDVKILKIVDVKEKPIVFFVAYYKSDPRNYVVGEKIVYNYVTQNIGHAYDGTEGVFTVPYDGYYLLNFSIFCAWRNWGVVDLYSDKGIILNRISVGDPATSWSKYTEGGTVAKLFKGEKVNPVLTSLRKGFKVYKRNNDDYYHNRFEGFLLKTL